MELRKLPANGTEVPATMRRTKRSRPGCPQTNHPRASWAALDRVCDFDRSREEPRGSAPWAPWRTTDRWRTRSNESSPSPSFSRLISVPLLVARSLSPFACSCRSFLRSRAVPYFKSKSWLPQSIQVSGPLTGQPLSTAAVVGAEHETTETTTATATATIEKMGISIHRL